MTDPEDDDFGPADDLFEALEREIARDRVMSVRAALRGMKGSFTLRDVQERLLEMREEGSADE